MKFLDTIAQFIQEHRLLNADGLHLVALSGGADSVCLLLVLQRLGYRVEAIHCNFNLRGDESKRDEQFVKDLCNKNGIKLHIAHFDTRTYAALHKVSIEMAARQLRYSYFDQLLHDIDAQNVCVAHHKDDSAETVLMNMIRGTGIHGLTGIKPRNGHIVRPLLCVSRKIIEQWLAEQGQIYVTDSTNLVPDVVRNKLRLQVMPLLCQIMGGATENILTTARQTSHAAKVYDAAMADILAILKATGSISIAKLQAQPSPESILFEWLNPLGFNSATIESIAMRLSSMQNGRQWLSATHQLIVHGQHLVVAPLQARRPTLLIPETGTYVYDDNTKFSFTMTDGAHITKDSTIACIDAHSLHFPLTIRPVRTNDRFRPFGMKGTKLVSDYLTDRKVSIIDKQRQLVVTDANGRIVWLVGHRPDDGFRVSTDTSQTILITITSNT